MEFPLESQFKLSKIFALLVFIAQIPSALIMASYTQLIVQSKL